MEGGGVVETGLTSARRTVVILSRLRIDRRSLGSSLGSLSLFSRLSLSLLSALSLFSRLSLSSLDSVSSFLTQWLTGGLFVVVIVMVVVVACGHSLLFVTVIAAFIYRSPSLLFSWSHRLSLFFLSCSVSVFVDFSFFCMASAIVRQTAFPLVHIYLAPYTFCWVLEIDFDGPI